MRNFYTVDRLQTLRSAQVLELTRFQDLQPPELQTHVDEMFPTGVSQHGDQYFLKNSSRANIASPAVELLFEYVRRSHFPDKPSRFQSWFGVESLDDAKAFRARFGAGTGTIWRVASKEFLRANMNLLTSQQTTLAYSWFAHAYWRGESGPMNPFWEFLLVPPVQVLGAVVEPALEVREGGGA